MLATMITNTKVNSFLEKNFFVFAEIAATEKGIERHKINELLANAAR